MSEEALRAAVRAERDGTVLVVLDDDPTGSQCVHDIPVITAWEPEDVRWALAQASAPGSGRAFFVLTNTRSLPASGAAQRIRRIVDVIAAVAGERGVPVEFLLRGDSTLRGHYPLESDLLLEHARAAGSPYDALLLVPAYIEAGRITEGDVHLVRRDGQLIPVAETDYARDASFGFASSDLREWVAEKTGGRIPATAVASIGRAELDAGPDAVAALLTTCRDGQPVVVNASSTRDLEVVALGVIRARARGVHVLARSGPSFVAALIGLEPRAVLAWPEIVPAARRGGRGLVVVGSHVELTTRQLGRLLARHPRIALVELDVRRLLADRDAELGRVEAELGRVLGGGDAVLATSRERVSGADAEQSLVIAAQVSSAIVELTARAVRARPLAWVVAKGGITSSDVATEALGIRHAVVLGQLFPGTVSVWSQVGSGESRRGGAEPDGLAYVVFAGNVGDAEALADAVEVLDGERAPISG